MTELTAFLGCSFSQSQCLAGTSLQKSWLAFRHRFRFHCFLFPEAPGNAVVLARLRATYLPGAHFVVIPNPPWLRFVRHIFSNCKCERLATIHVRENFVPYLNARICMRRKATYKGIRSRHFELIADEELPSGGSAGARRKLIDIDRRASGIFSHHLLGACLEAFQ